MEVQHFSVFLWNCQNNFTSEMESKRKKNYFRFFRNAKINGKVYLPVYAFLYMACTVETTDKIHCIFF